MGTKQSEIDSKYLLFEHRSLDKLQEPLNRSSRLKYNCVSVSSKFIVVGANTGGIYIFSRNDLKLLQIAFADKAANSVTLVQISPNEKLVAFFSLNSVHVVDMRLETRSKPETVRSTDIPDCTITCMIWDSTSSKLYIGDDLGRVSLIPVHSNKAKNLFSTPLEVILKLDSMVVQLDKVEEKILVSTWTRCYLCDTTRHQFSQVGKKLREGQYGACFLSQTSSAAMIYCARPGSRIWEVDYSGTVMNTHQFKQLLATPPAPIMQPQLRAFQAPGHQECASQAVAFPKLKVICNNFLLCWTSTTIYIIDPLEVKVILWSDSFEGIQDVCCDEDQLFIFFNNMQLQCLSLMPVSKAIACCLATKIPPSLNSYLSAARLILHYKTSLLSKCAEDLLNPDICDNLCDTLIENGHQETVKLLKEVFEELEANSKSEVTDGRTADKRVFNEVDNDKEHMDTGDNKSVDYISSDTDTSSGAGVNAAIDFSQAGGKGISDKSNNEIYGRMTEYAETADDKTKCATNSDTVNNAESVVDCTDGIEHGSQLNIGAEGTQNLDVAVISNHESSPCDSVTSVGEITDIRLKDTELGAESAKDRHTVDTQVENHTILPDMPEEGKTPDKISHFQDSKLNGFKDIPTDNTPVNASLDTSSPAVYNSGPIPSVIVDRSNDSDQDLDDENFPFRNSKILAKRPSLTSLSSLSSTEISFEQPADAIEVLGEQIAIPVKRRSSKKRVRKHRSVDEGGERHKTDRSKSPQGSIDESTETDCISIGEESHLELAQSVIPSTDERLTSHDISIQDGVFDQNVELRGRRQPRHISRADELSKTNANAEVVDSLEEDQERQNGVKCGDIGQTIKINQMRETMQNRHLAQSLELSQSGEFSQSGELSRSFDMEGGREQGLGNSGNYGSSEGTSPSEGQLERQMSQGSARKVAFRQLKDKMQTKVTAKTKQIVQSIKDKNLLSKAKELAENLSQIQSQQEVLLATGGMFYIDESDVQTSEQNEAAETEKPEDFVDSGIENSIGSYDSIKIPIDISELEEATAKTVTLLEDIETLMNINTTYAILSNWITVLNRTFFEYHQKCSSQSYSVVHKQCPRSKNGPVLSEEHCKHIENNNDAMDDIHLKHSCESVDSKADGNNSITNVHHQCIMYQHSFCFIKDPLHLPPVLHGKILELAQACFDVGCHGNISTLFHFQCEGCSDLSETDKPLVNENEVLDTKCHCSKLCEDTKTDMDGSDAGSVTKDGSHDQQGNENVKELCEENTENENVDQVKDDELHVTDEHKSGKLYSGSHVHTGVKHDFKNTDHYAESLEQTLTPGCCEDTVTLTSKSASAQVATASSRASFVRLYFPYLSPGRVREQVLKGSNQYEVWCALMDCLQEHSTLDREKYGIGQGQVIQHILDSRAMADPGVNLLGHIGKLFATSSPAAIQSCVRCYPRILPVEVLYCCQHYGISMETFSTYTREMLEEANVTHSSSIKESLYDHPYVRKTCLETLLSRQNNSELFDAERMPRERSHQVCWENQSDIHGILDTVCSKGDNQEVQTILDVCKSFGYWKGALTLLQHLKSDLELVETILHLGDVTLLGDTELGFQPKSETEWENVLACFSKYQNKTRNHTECAEVSDWSNRITWDKLGILLVRYLGPDTALALLEKHCVSARLSADFFKMCLMAGIVSKHQRCILHSMLEKVDTYLWSERPTSFPNKLHFLAVNEKQLRSHGNKSGPDTETIQTLASSLKADRDAHFYLDEPDSHWGIQVKFNKSCPCCNISLKTAVSHEESGVVLFPCGHGFHKLCLPGKLCIFCDVQTS